MKEPLLICSLPPLTFCSCRRRTPVISSDKLVNLEACFLSNNPASPPDSIAKWKLMKPPVTESSMSPTMPAASRFVNRPNTTWRSTSLSYGTALTTPQTRTQSLSASSTGRFQHSQLSRWSTTLSHTKASATWWRHTQKNAGRRKVLVLGSRVDLWPISLKWYILSLTHLYLSFPRPGWSVKRGCFDDNF